MSDLYRDYLAKKDRLAKAKNYLEYFKKTHGYEEFPYWRAFHQAVQDEKDAWAAFNKSLTNNR